MDIGNMPYRAAHGIKERRAAAYEVFARGELRNLCDRQAIVDHIDFVVKEHRRYIRFSLFLLLLCKHGVKSADSIRFETAH